MYVYAMHVCVYMLCMCVCLCGTWCSQRWTCDSSLTAFPSCSLRQDWVLPIKPRCFELPNMAAGNQNGSSTTTLKHLLEVVFILFCFECFACMYLAAAQCLPGAWGSQKRALNALQLELRTALHRPPYGCWDLSVGHVPERAASGFNC